MDPLGGGALRARPLSEAISLFRCDLSSYGPFQVCDLLPYLFDPSQVCVEYVVEKGMYQGMATVLCMLPSSRESGGRLYATYSREYGSCPGCEEYENIDERSYEALVQRVTPQILTSARPEPYDIKFFAGIPRERDFEEYSEPGRFLQGDSVSILRCVRNESDGTLAIKRVDTYFVPYGRSS